MPRNFKSYLPEKDYAHLLILGLALLVISQIFSKQAGTLALVLRWFFLLAAVVNYGYVLYLYDRDRRAKKSKSDQAEKDSEIKDQTSKSK